MYAILSAIIAAVAAIIAAILGALVSWFFFTYRQEFKNWQAKKLGKVRLLKIIKNQAEHLQKYFEEIIVDLNKNEKIIDPFYDFPFDLNDNIINLITQYDFNGEENGEKNEFNSNFSNLWNVKSDNIHSYVDSGRYFRIRL